MWIRLKKTSLFNQFRFYGCDIGSCLCGTEIFFLGGGTVFVIVFLCRFASKPLRFLDKKTKHKAHGLLSVVLVILSICVIIVPLSFLISALINKISEFLKFLLEQLNDLPSFLATLENWLLNFCGFLPEHLYKSVSASITEWFTKLQPNAPEEAGAVSGLLSGIDLSSVSDKITSGVSNVYSVLKGVPSILIGVVIGIVAWILFTKDYDIVVKFIQNQLPEGKKNILVDLKQVFSKTILTMFKAYGFIMLITFSEICLGFGIMRMCGIMNNNFFVLIAAAIAIFDILPVAGSGGILIPWALFPL